jgi:hypothetical protein
MEIPLERSEIPLDQLPHGTVPTTSVINRQFASPIISEAIKNSVGHEAFNRMRCAVRWEADYLVDKRVLVLWFRLHLADGRSVAVGTSKALEAILALENAEGSLS